MKYRVVWTVAEVREEFIEASSEDEARSRWENEPKDYWELFFIEDEDGKQNIYCLIEKWNNY